LAEQYANVSDHRCAMCGQDLHDTKQEKMLAELESKILKIDADVLQLSAEVIELDSQLNEFLPMAEALQYNETTYATIDQAYQHKNSIAVAQAELTKLQTQTNPYQDQIQSLQDAIQEIDYDTINTLSILKDHQEFLLKLLTNKDSFIRKRIINQNILFLNNRLKEYATKLNLEHEIKFENDLGVEITYMGQSLDFYNLSRGEGTRLTLSLNLAMRDIFENLKTPFGLLFIDEMLDQGLDSSGVEKTVELLKHMSRSRNKTVFVISHREELIPRSQNILTVIKEGGFSRFDWDYALSA
jgi:DNA repair exonuclease SbcCD ATPase subunit